ncbi:uncharacterized protein MONOS_18324 [Monocercomonoides exilis]|uniref:uncharacterized protein n=1 Tax=Monocercomonoides exilis TaxID=2049356 RepID=UPI003559D785|nr:hypothetical protein MONOS_18324 [Monocercomonoides exilis]
MEKDRELGMQFWRTRKPAGLIITNPLEMGKYFKAKKMIGHEQECHGKKPFYPFSKDSEVLRLSLFGWHSTMTFVSYHLFCMLHSLTMLNMIATLLSGMMS